MGRETLAIKSQSPHPFSIHMTTNAPSAETPCQITLCPISVSLIRSAKRVYFVLTEFQSWQDRRGSMHDFHWFLSQHSLPIGLFYSFADLPIVSKLYILQMHSYPKLRQTASAFRVCSSLILWYPTLLCT